MAKELKKISSYQKPLWQYILSPKRGLFIAISAVIFTVFAMLNIDLKVSAATGINRTINFQGKVVNSNGTNVADGQYTFVFKLHDAPSGGANPWTETQNNVQVTGGVFRVSLGSVTTFASAGVDFNTDNLYLGINFNSDGEMTPRVRFAAVPYAINAEKVAGLTVTNTTGTFTLTDGKTFSVSNTVGFTGTDGTTFALPGTSGTIVTLDASQSLTNKTIGSSGLTFSGATTDITTGTNESLTIAADGTGNVLVQSGSGGQAALIVDKTGSGDIFAASSSGVTKFVIKSDGTASSSAGFVVDGVGSLQSTNNQTLTVGGGQTGDLVIGRTSQRVYLPGFDTCTALETSGGILSCGSDSTGGGDNFWQYDSTTGIVANGNLTTDFLLGATSTPSAKFAVLNIAGTQTPVASISAQNASAQALVLGGDGTIQSVRNNSLTLGGDTTGNIFLRPQNNAGLVTIVHAGIGTGGLKLTSSEADSVNKEGRIKIGHYLSSEEPVTLIFGQSLNTQNNIFIGGNSGSENAATEINFLTALNNTTVTGTRRMRINQYGDVSIGIQGVDPDARLHVKGGTTGGNASMIVDQIGDSANDIFSASASGTTKFVIKNDGTASSSAGFVVDGVGSLQSTNNQTLTVGGGSTGDLVIGRASQTVQLPGFANCTALETSGGVLSCGSDASGISGYDNFWQYNSTTGIVANGNLTTDFLVGGTSTQSAKFSVLGIAGTDTPVASVSAIGGANDTKGIYISGDGSLQSVRNNTLIIGGNTTGDVSFKPGNVSTPALYLSSSGNVGIGTTIPTSALDVVGSLLLGANSTIDTRASGSLSIGTAANTTSLALGRSGNTTTFNSTSWTATPTISGLITATSGVSIATGQSYTGAGTVTLSSASDNDLTLTAAGSGNIIITSDANTGVRIGDNAVASALFVGGGIGGNAGFILNRVGSTDDILAASASGTTKFVIKNDGTASSSAGFVVDGVGSLQSTNNQTLTVGGGSTGELVIGRTSQVVWLPGFDCSGQGNGGKLTTTSGGVLTCSADTSGGGGNFWQYDSTTGIIAPGNLTADLLFGGTSTASAGFRITGATKDYGTVAAASVSANTSFAGLVIDNKGVGDLFTASSSGVTQLVLTNNGALGIGTNAPTAKLDVNGSASISGLLAFRTGAGQIQTTANNSLTIGGGTTGNIIFPNAGGIFLGQNELVNGLITLFSSGVGETDPSIYADASGNLILSAPTGTVQMGNGSGNITMSLTNVADLFAADKTVTLASNYSGTDFSFSRVLTGGANSQGGAIFSITDTSGGSGTINPDMLLVNAALTSGNFQGTLGRFQQSGIDKLRIYGNGTSPVATISANTSFAGLVADQNGLGDIFTASTGGVTKFTVMNSGELYTSNYRNNGGILYTNTNGILGQTTVGSNNECLKSVGGGTPTWGTCGGGGAAGTWTIDSTTGIHTPINNTLDLLIGGTSTQSAKFSVLGIAGTDTPVASVSATSGVNIDKGIYLSGDGSLQSVRKNNLTIGGSTTGDIYLRPGNSQGLVKIIHQDAATSGLLVTDSETQSTNKTGRIKFGSYDVTNGYVTGMLASSEVSANQLFIGGGSATENAATVIRFRTAQNVGTLAGTERMRIDNYGWVGVGEIGDASTALQSQLYVTGGSQGANAALIVNQTGSATNDILVASASGTTKFVIKNDGTASSSAGFVIDGVGSFQSTKNQTLTIGGDTTGNVLIKPGNTQGLTFLSNGRVGIGTSNPLSTLDVRAQNGTVSVASVSGATSFAGLVVDNSGSGDIFTASSSGMTRFTIRQSGLVLIGSASNGLSFDYLNGPSASNNGIFSGTARPTKSITLWPEYAGAVITASGSASTTGSMTTDASASAQLNRTYYEWISTSTSLQDYVVAIRITLPADFSDWPSGSNAMTISYNTGSSNTSTNGLDVYIYNSTDDSTGRPVYFSTNNVSAKSWTTLNLTQGQLDNGVSPDWDSAGESVTIYFKMKASGTYNYTQIGDITLNYLSKF
ncbi:MAG: hypothetical protein Q7T54_01945 [Candidatus Levybacteria bacterium]|nr:hypothetical protein [Candidatus Levybacteria bacterium]